MEYALSTVLVSSFVGLLLGICIGMVLGYLIWGYGHENQIS